jgi:cephalosporin hydroxylase
MDPIRQFEQERVHDIKKMARDDELKKKSLDWMLHADKYKYTYNFKWLGRPIIKYPNDIVLLQEIIWEVKPDLIIETGIAHGGSLIFSASMLELLGGDREVVGVDIDIRKHNRKEIESHPMFKRVTMIEGSSTSQDTIAKIREVTKRKTQVMVCLDSNHTHEHVLKELHLYSPFVTVGSYMVLPDTFIEYFPKGYFKNRPWDVGNNPMTAIREFLSKSDNFIIDKEKVNKLLITEGFDGYLKRIK